VYQLRTFGDGGGGILVRGGGVSECVKLRRQTFDIFAVYTPDYKPDSSVFSLGGYQQHPPPYPNLNASKFISLLLNLKKWYISTKESGYQKKKGSILLRNACITYKPVSCHNPDAKVNLYSLEYLKSETLISTGNNCFWSLITRKLLKIKGPENRALWKVSGHKERAVKKADWDFP